MKLRLLTFIFFILGSYSAGAEGLRKLSDSEALTTVFAAFEEASLDLDGHYLVEDNAHYLGEGSICDVVGPESILEHFTKTIEHYRSFYPDEELPYDQAKTDLLEIIGSNQAYEQCIESQSDDFESVQVTQYQGLETSLALSFKFAKELF